MQFVYRQLTLLIVSVVVLFRLVLLHLANFALLVKRATTLTNIVFQRKMFYPFSHPVGCFPVTTTLQ
jgi:hypothetical protein